MAVIVDYGRGSHAEGRAKAAAGGAHGVRARRAGAAGGRGGVREVEGRAGKACKHARAAGEHAHDGVTGKAYAKAAENANALLLLAVGLVLAMGLMWGQACQRAYLDGQAHGIASAKAEADAQAYDRGYAAAVYEYREGEAAWAR